jgi:hypothetical protein
LPRCPHLRQSGIGWRFLALRDSPWPGRIRYSGATASLGAYYHYRWNVAVAMCLVIEQVESRIRLVRLVLDEDGMAEDRWRLEVAADQAAAAVLEAAGDIVVLMWEDVGRARAQSGEG